MKKQLIVHFSTALLFLKLRRVQRIAPRPLPHLIHFIRSQSSKISNHILWEIHDEIPVVVFVNDTET